MGRGRTIGHGASSALRASTASTTLDVARRAARPARLRIALASVAASGGRLAVALLGVACVILPIVALARGYDPSRAVVVLPVLGLGVLLWAALPRRQPHIAPYGVELADGGEPDLERALAEIVRGLGARAPDRVEFGDGVVVFARRRRAWFRRPVTVLTIGWPVFDLLDVDQFRGMLARAIARVEIADTVPRRRIERSRRNLWTSVSRAREQGPRRLAAWYQQVCDPLERSYDATADLRAAQLVGASTMRSALHAIDAARAAWSDYGSLLGLAADHGYGVPVRAGWIERVGVGPRRREQPEATERARPLRYARSESDATLGTDLERRLVALDGIVETSTARDRRRAAVLLHDPDAVVASAHTWWYGDDPPYDAGGWDEFAVAVVDLHRIGVMRLVTDEVATFGDLPGSAAGWSRYAAAALGDGATGMTDEHRRRHVAAGVARAAGAALLDRGWRPRFDESGDMAFTLDGRSTTPARWARSSRAQHVDAAGVVAAVSRCGLANVRFDQIAPPEEVAAARRTADEPAADAHPAEPTDLGRWVVGHGGVRAKPVTFDGVTLRAGDRELRVDAVTRVRAMDLMAHGPDDHFDLRTERAHIHISKSMRDKPGRIGKPSPQVVRDVRLVRGLIERHIVPRLAAEHIARVERGETLEFRNCQVDRSGIRLRRRPGRWTEIPWSEFSHLDVDRYHVEVYRSTPQADGRAGKVHFRVTNAIVLPTIVPELHRRYAR